MSFKKSGHLPLELILKVNLHTRFLMQFCCDFHWDFCCIHAPNSCDVCAIWAQYCWDFYEGNLKHRFCMRTCKYMLKTNMVWFSSQDSNPPVISRRNHDQIPLKLPLVYASDLKLQCKHDKNRSGHRHKKCTKINRGNQECKCHAHNLHSRVCPKKPSLKDLVNLFNGRPTRRVRRGRSSPLGEPPCLWGRGTTWTLVQLCNHWIADALKFLLSSFIFIFACIRPAVQPVDRFIAFVNNYLPVIFRDLIFYLWNEV